MKKILLLLGIFLLWSCSGDDEIKVDDENDLSQEEIERKEHEKLRYKLGNSKIIFDFGVQHEELIEELEGFEEHHLKRIDPLEEYAVVSDETPIFGKYQTQVNSPYGDSDWIILPNFVIQQKDRPIDLPPGTSQLHMPPHVTHTFFYENNERSYEYSVYPEEEDVNRPHYQVLTFIDIVNDETYDIVKEWIKSFEEIKKDFEPVNDLKYIKERIVQDDITIEIGYYYYEEEINNSIIVRFYSSKEPEYAQYIE